MWLNEEMQKQIEHDYCEECKQVIPNIDWTSPRGLRHSSGECVLKSEAVMIEGVLKIHPAGSEGGYKNGGYYPPNDEYITLDGIWVDWAKFDGKYARITIVEGKE